MFFSLFIFLCCFPFCFPVVLPYCIPRCTTPSLGRSPRANRWKNDDLGLVPIFKKNIFHKTMWFSIFSFDWYTDSILKQLNKLKNVNMCFSLFIFLCRFPFCFPVVLPYCIPRCTTPSLGRSPRANRWKNDDLGLVPIFQKKNHKNLWFSIFSFDLYTDSILKQLNKLKNINMFFSLFIFLCCFPFCFPVVLPYCIPCCTTPSLGRSPRANRWKNDDLGLVPIFKNIFHKNLWFSIFSFDLYTDSILKQLNKLKNVNMCFSLFIFLCCFPFCFPVVVPYCIPRCTTPSLGRSPRANRWKNDDLGLVPIFQKKNHKNLWFSIFSFDLYTDRILKAIK